MRNQTVCVALLGLLLSACLTARAEVPASPAVPSQPPVAARKGHTQKEHGVVREDFYYWLRNREDPAVRQYLEAENAWTAATLAPYADLRKQLVTEMRSRIVDEDVSVPYRRGSWLYYDRYPAGADYQVYCRKPLSGGAEQILLDLNERAKDQPTYLNGGAKVSPDEKLLAWKENFDGTDSYVLRVKEIESGKILPDEIAGTAFAASPVWSLDNRTLFYTEADETQRSCRVKRHVLGTPASADVVVYEEPDARFQVVAETTKDLRFLIIGTSTKDTSENRLIPLDDPGAAPQVVEPRKDKLRYGMAPHGDQWYILSNDGAKDGRLFCAPLESPARDKWIEVWPGQEGVSYEWVETFQTHVVVGARVGGVPGFFVLEPKSGGKRWFPVPVEGGWIGMEPTPEYLSKAQRISYGSFLVPYTVADVDLATGEVKVLDQKKVPAGFDAGKYRIEKTAATAADGVKIPIWVLLPVNHPQDGSGGLLLSGYGAYGSPNDPWFDTDIFSLLDRGVGYAVAQIRGGGEFGRSWYEAGKLANKETTFSDFAACAEHLIQDKFTSKEQLCGLGGSAGGLLAGAVVNKWPGLFRAFVADVPFVDVLNTMLDPTIPLTTSEYDEWGNPTASKEDFDLIGRYSPYDNVTAQAYPALLVTAGWNDPRVPYWESAKWVAKLRAMKTDKNILLLHTNLDTGHGGTSGRYSYLEDVAMKYAFILGSLGRVGIP